MRIRERRAKTAITQVFCVACTLIALCWFACARARADAELELVWRSPVGCPDAAWATQRVATQLGRAPDKQVAEPLRAHVEITRSGETFRLLIRTARGDTHGERTVHDARCEDLAEAATLIIALAIDPDAVLGAQAGSEIEGQTAQAGASEQGTRAATDSETAPFLRPRLARDRRARMPTVFRARASALGDVGFLPEMSVGPELAVGIHRGLWGAETGGFWLPAQSSGGAQRVVVSMWALGVRGCLQHVGDRVLLGGCLGFELGRVSADGHGLDQNLEKRSLHAAFAVPMRGRLRVAGPVWLALDLGLSVPFYRQRFVTRDTSDDRQTVLHTPQLITARGSLGAELTF